MTKIYECPRCFNKRILFVRSRPICTICTGPSVNQKMTVIGWINQFQNKKQLAAKTVYGLRLNVVDIVVVERENCRNLLYRWHAGRLAPNTNSVWVEQGYTADLVVATSQTSMRGIPADALNRQIQYTTDPKHFGPSPPVEGKEDVK